MTELSAIPTLRPAEAAEFQRHPEGQAYLEAVRAASVTPEDLQRIVEVCNQPLILGHLKETLTDGQPYTMSFAQDLVHIGERGWETGKGFIYFIRDAQRQIVGAIDIKSNDADAEVGFWADADNPGYVTNALASLAGLAENAGFKSLYGLVDPANDRSAGVFRRLGWQESKDHDGANGLLHFSYVLGGNGGVASDENS